DLYGDRSRVATVRAEMSRMRKQLPGLVLGQPYRVAEQAVVDVWYPDDMSTLLAASTAPAIRAAREGMPA
ncbi:MAG TPA: transcriptional regulator, partial [Mycobacterium sp.]|nr:transcriptional regulator [Mycobacterium sp.]